MKIQFNKELVEKSLSVLSVVVAGAVAVVNAASDQKKAAEFEELKKAVAELQNK